MQELLADDSQSVSSQKTQKRSFFDNSRLKTRHDTVTSMDAEETDGLLDRPFRAESKDKRRFLSVQ